jgi:hypothetical protein
MASVYFYPFGDEESDRQLFKTLDDDTSGAGQVLANEIFTSDGIMHTASG